MVLDTVVITALCRVSMTVTAAGNRCHEWAVKSYVEEE